MTDDLLARARAEAEKRWRLSKADALRSVSLADWNERVEAVNACDVFTEDRINDHLVANFSSGRTEVPYEEEAANRRLFLTLHETIDPMLAILRDGIAAWGMTPGGLIRAVVIEHALALARAINQNGEQA